MDANYEKTMKNHAPVEGIIMVLSRRLFGQYGFHGMVIRMMIRKKGIDISTLH